MGERVLGLACAISLAALAATGCKGAPCIRHSDCDPGLVCSPTGACLLPAGPDGGVDDDGGMDAADDASIDAADDAADDAGIDAADDAGIDAAIDAATDAGIDAGIDAAIDAGIDAAPSPPVLESPFAGPRPPSMDPTLGVPPTGDPP